MSAWGSDQSSAVPSTKDGSGPEVTIATKGGDQTLTADRTNGSYGQQAGFAKFPSGYSIGSRKLWALADNNLAQRPKSDLP